MPKKDKISFLIVIGSAVLLAGAAILIIHTSKKKKYTMDDISKFIKNPKKLNSSDDNTGTTWKKMDTELLAKLEKISKEIGKKLYITSGYRSPAYNKSIGGATRSAHMSGHAVDIDTNSYAESIKIGKLAKKLGIIRMGANSSFIHLDTHPTLPPTQWAYGGNKLQLQKDLGFK